MKDVVDGEDDHQELVAADVPSPFGLLDTADITTRHDSDTEEVILDTSANGEDSEVDSERGSESDSDSESESDEEMNEAQRMLSNLVAMGAVELTPLKQSRTALVTPPIPPNPPSMSQIEERSEDDDDAFARDESYRSPACRTPEEKTMYSVPSSAVSLSLSPSLVACSELTLPQSINPERQAAIHVWSFLTCIHSLQVHARYLTPCHRSYPLSCLSAPLSPLHQ